MATADAKGAILSDDERRQLESWVEGFDREWGDGLLASRASDIPPDSSLRLPALTEMVKIDLERQWQRGHRITLEAYLAQYPELGTPADVSADLIRVEYDVRRRFGAPADLDHYARRFPRQAEALRHLIESPPPPAPEPVVAPSPGSSRRIPRQFGRYEILKPLGRGGMGAVFLAQDTKLGRKVALKVPSFGPEDGPEALARFDREARAAATLDHPNICPVFDVGVIDGAHYLTMAYIEGKSLADTIAEKGPHSPRQAAAIVGKLALALQEAHARGIVHRDLKPSNVMMKEAGKRREPVLVDFGLARELGTEDVRLTQSGTALGTVAYMAPEQVRSETTIGPCSDIYGLGVILYELLTGGPPFEGPAFVVAAQILTQEPPLPSSLRPDLDPRIEAICLKAMSKSIAARYATMADFAAAIAEYLRAAPAPTPAPPQSPSQAAAMPRPAADRVETSSGDMQVAQFLGRQAGLPDASSSHSDLVSPGADAEAPEPEADPSGEGTGRRPGMIALAAAAAAAMILLAIVIYVATNKGRIKIVVDDSKAVVKVDGDVVRIGGLGEPITLRAGEHDLEVSWGPGEFTTRKFVVRRGENEALKVTYEPLAIPRAEQGGKPLKSVMPGEMDRRAAMTVLSLGGDVTIRVNGQEQQIGPGKALPPVPFEVTRIVLKGEQPGLTDAGLEPFEGMKSLTEFSLFGGKAKNVTDAGIAHLRNLPELKVLWLDGTSVTDAGLVHLEGLPTLETLGLRGTAVTDAGLVHLQKLTKLKLLALGSTRVTDAGLMHLRGLSQIGEIWLENTNIKGSGLVHFQNMKNLWRILLHETSVTDAELEHLKRLPQLKELSLSGPRVTDAGLVHLRGLSQLESLAFYGASITDSGLAHLDQLSTWPWFSFSAIDRYN